MRRNIDPTVARMGHANRPDSITQEFDPEELAAIQCAILAVLNAAPFTNVRRARRREIRALAARCVLNEARMGERDPATLAYKSSVMFCAAQSMME